MCLLLLTIVSHDAALCISGKFELETRLSPTRCHANFGHTLRAYVRRSTRKMGPASPAFQGHLRSSEYSDMDRSAAYDFL